jgi:hypothetical protein
LAGYFYGHLVGRFFAALAGSVTVWGGGLMVPNAHKSAAPPRRPAADWRRWFAWDTNAKFTSLRWLRCSL